MSITVEEALNLNAMKTAEVVAGKDGLSRLIHRVSVSECPEFESIAHKNWEEDSLFQPGDFFITSFYSIKDNEDQMMKTVELYNRYQSSGLCIIDLYLKELPAQINEYANMMGYPIIFINSKVAYAELISEIMECIYLKREHKLFSMTIDKIRKANNPGDIKKMAFSINKLFKEKSIGAYISEGTHQDAVNQYLNKINDQKAHIAVKYKQGVLILYTWEQDEIDIAGIKEELAVFTGIRTGISQIHEHVHDLNKSINEAMIAAAFAEIHCHSVVEYEELGIYKWLYLLRESDELKEYSNTVIKSLSDYDKNNSTELLKTAGIYIDNDGDFKKTAKVMFQHENTIRYRIAKIKSILKMNNRNIEFYEKLSIAVKAKKMESLKIR